MNLRTYINYDEIKFCDNLI